MPYIAGKYYTHRQLDEIKDKLDDEEFEKFLTSGIIGAVTGSALLGGIIGGDLLGGILGDILGGDD